MKIQQILERYILRTPICLAFFGLLLHPHIAQCQSAPATRNYWSVANISSLLQKKDATFRGLFPAQPDTLSWEKLEKHAWVTLRFKLLLTGSWDGSNLVWGPDLWTLQVRGGQRLIFTTFCNLDYANNSTQSFPDEYPWGRQSSRTGAEAKNSLHLLKRDSALPLRDTTYPIEVTFPHSDASLVLDFAGIYDDPAFDDQTWGIANVELSVSDEGPSVTDDELPELWTTLASDDAVAANASLRQMIGGTDRTIQFISDRISEIEDRPSSDQPPVEGSNTFRLHRAKRILQIIGGPLATELSFKIDHLIPEYYLGLKNQR